MFLGKCAITACVVAVGYLIITNTSAYSDKIESPIGPCMIFFFEGYIVSVLFMSIWSQACDIVLQCYFAEKEIFGRIEFAPDEFADFIDTVDGTK